jgi:hypothetical protein
VKGSWYAAEQSRAFVREALQTYLLTAEGRMALIEWAQDPKDDCQEEARAVLDAALLELESRGEERPTELRYYAMQLARHAIPYKSSRGGPKVNNRLLRSIVICLMVADDVARFSSRPTGVRRVGVRPAWSSARRSK